jgi:MFS family permease
MTAVATTLPMPWPRIVALAASQLVAWGVLYYAFAVIVGPMGLETGWSKPEMHGAQSLGLGISGLGAYAVGRRIDRYGGRGLMVCGAVLGALAVLLWSQVTALWQLYGVCALIGVASSMTLYEAAFAVTARMVPGNYRRAIVAITLLGGLASTVFIPVTHWLTEGLGWRHGLMALAATELAICAAVPWFALKDGPEPAGRKRKEPVPEERKIFPLVRRQAVFWLLLASYVSFAFFYSSLLFSLLPMLGERGFTLAAAVALYAMIGPSQVAGRLAMFALDRVLPVEAAGMAATLLPVAAMLILVWLTAGSGLALLFSVLFGAGMGIKTVVQATAAPEFLGIREYGALQGILSTPVQLVQAASPFAAALLWQWSGNYNVLDGLLLACTIVSAATFGAAAWLARNIPRPSPLYERNR